MIYIESYMLNFDNVDLLDCKSGELSSWTTIIDAGVRLSTLVCAWCKFLIGANY